MSGVLRRSGAGVMKLTQLKEKLAACGMAWTEDFSPGAVKAIGSLEVLAAIGLILPAVLNIVPVMVPVAALGLILLMIGAAITHARRREPPGDRGQPGPARVSRRRPLGSFRAGLHYRLTAEEPLVAPVAGDIAATSRNCLYAV
jgi:DoxX-like family